MATIPRVRVTFDTNRIALDMAARGWEQKDLAASALVSQMTVSRFLREERQTVKTAARLARALGHSVRRYLVRQSEAA